MGSSVGQIAGKMQILDRAPWAEKQGAWAATARYFGLSGIFARFFPESVVMERMTQNTSGFSRRGPDIITEELVAVLLKNNTFEFKSLFEVIHANLRARKAASGGEEMLRLRAYEKLQTLVGAGVVKKTGKSYQGIKQGLAALSTRMQEFHAKIVRPAA